MKKADKPKAGDVYERITAQIIADLEKGSLPWMSPWNVPKAKRHVSTLHDIWPRNALTYHPYSGANVFQCWIHMHTLNVQGSAPIFLTFKQAKENGGHVKKGERACVVIGYGKGTKLVEDGEGEVKAKRWMAPFAHYVFHISQTEGVELPKRRDETPPSGLDDDAKWQAFLKATKADVRHGGGKAFYSIDYVQMPAAKHFKTKHHYKAVMLHELTHWTGYKLRLDRKIMNVFASHDYAFEELVAEFGAAFLCAKLGVEHKEMRHADYIKTWLSAIKHDKKMVVQAASKAMVAANYILELTKEAIASKPKGKRRAADSRKRNRSGPVRAGHDVVLVAHT